MNSVFEPLVLAGIPNDLVYFLLLVPFIVMILTFAKYVVGVKTLGVFEVLSMTFMLGFIIREYSIYSAFVGLVLLILIYIISYYIKKLTVNIGLHYFSRVSVILSFISVCMLLILYCISRFTSYEEILQFSNAPPFAFLIAVLISEHFSSNQTQKGIKISRMLLVRSLFFAFIVGLLVSLNSVEQFLLTNYYLIIVWIILTFLLGRYKGMRLSEILRFKDVRLESLNN